MKDATSGVHSAIETAASNPKVATVIAASTASIGAASKLEIIQGYLSIVSMCIGIATALVVLAFQTIKFMRFYREWQNENRMNDD